MLRIRYMPSDFHPLVLILGDRGDLQDLAALFDHFIGDGGDIDLDKLAVPSSTPLRMTAASRELGVQLPETGEGEDISGRLVWRLDQAVAEEFRDRIREISAAQCASGSVTLECGVPDETPVKVSHGEFTEDFLMPDSRIPG